MRRAGGREGAADGDAAARPGERPPASSYSTCLRTVLASRARAHHTSVCTPHTRVQHTAHDPAEKSPGGGDGLSYEDLSKPVVERARSLLRFVPVFRRANTRGSTPRSSPVAARTEAELSPSKRWQQVPRTLVESRPAWFPRCPLRPETPHPRP
eukprot:1746784-Rhodomonas_salina.3